MADAERIERLEREIEELKRENERLRKQIEELLRQNKRQTAPFRKEHKKKNPAKPGRKAGEKHGGHAGRVVPSKIEETHPAPLPSRCGCGGRIDLEDVKEQFQEDIVRQIVRRRFQVEIGHCASCGRRHQGRHPLQTSDALGAAAVQIGPEAYALAAELRLMGLSHGNAARILEVGYGLEVERSTLSRGLLRTALRARPTYQELVVAVRKSPTVWLDETSWRVYATNRWLWVAASREAVIYAIRCGRGFLQAAGILGKDYSGTIHHDGLRSYYSFLEAMHQSCLAHLVRRCREMIEAAGGQPSGFVTRVLGLFRSALTARERYDQGKITLHGMRVIGGQLLHQKLDALLSEPLSSEADERFASHLAHELSALFTFLWNPLVEATNNYAERLLRWMIMARKTWGGNRTYTGAFIQETLASILATYRVQKKDHFPALVALRRSPVPLLLHEIIPVQQDSS